MLFVEGSLSFILLRDARAGDIRAVRKLLNFGRKKRSKEDTSWAGLAIKTFLKREYDGRIEEGIAEIGTSKEELIFLFPEIFQMEFGSN